MLWYSVEVPQWGTFYEYPQHIFLWRNKEKYPHFLVKKTKQNKHHIRSYDWSALQEKLGKNLSCSNSNMINGF